MQKKAKRIMPASVTVYFPGEKVEILRELEEVSKKINMPMSALMVNLAKMSLPNMQYFAASVNGENLGVQISKITVERDHEAERINNIALRDLEKTKK